MYVLGLTYSHLATAALLKDGAIVAAASEERFTGRKNQPGIPVKSIKYCLEFANIKARDLDLVVIGFTSLPFYFASVGSVGKFKGRKYETYYILKKIYFFIRYKLVTQIAYRVPGAIFLERLLDLPLELLGKTSTPYEKQKKLIFESTGIPPEKIVFADHHLCHALSGLYFSPYPQKGKDALVFTADGQGDGLSATVSIYKNGKLKRASATPLKSSLGFFYLYVTKFLGMKPLEHEYKVMGLAPYAPEFGKREVYKRLSELIWLDKKTLSFMSKISAHHFELFFKDKLYGQRFDFVAAGAQELVENLLTDWVREAVKKYKIGNIVVSGGTFLNVKANKKIAELPEVKKMFIMPSPGDESTPFGACYWGYLKLTDNKRVLSAPSSLYLGSEFTNKQVKDALKRYNKKYNIQRVSDMENTIARLLARGKIVARFAGRMEWGARALGNRSILADASNIEVKETINKMIKSRDFWMPFAPTILSENATKYLINPKNIEAPYMVLAFNTKPGARDDLAAAIHPDDKTARPQVISKKGNSKYYKILKKFKEITGRGVILNTSFNLHGYPIVRTPKDALRVFKNSSLSYMALENYLVTKR